MVYSECCSRINIAQSALIDLSVHFEPQKSQFEKCTKCTIKTLINQKKDFWKTDIRAGAESAPRWNHFSLKKKYSKDLKSLTERKNDYQRRPKNSKFFSRINLRKFLELFKTLFNSWKYSRMSQLCIYIEKHSRMNLSSEDPRTPFSRAKRALS